MASVERVIRMVEDEADLSRKGEIYEAIHGQGGSEDQ